MEGLVGIVQEWEPVRRFYLPHGRRDWAKKSSRGRVPAIVHRQPGECVKGGHMMALGDGNMDASAPISSAPRCFDSTLGVPERFGASDRVWWARMLHFWGVRARCW